MYILLALIATIAVGIGLHFALPYRDTRGVILTPGIAAIVTAVVYAGLTWLQWGEGNLWLWVISIASAIVVALVATVVIGALRTRHDAAERRRLKLV